MLDALKWVIYDASWWINAAAVGACWSLRVVGRENVPKTGPALLLANHQSYLDPPCIGSSIPRYTGFLARKQLFKNPLFGGLLHQLNSVPVDQEGIAKEGLKAILAKLQAGYPVLIFPEGSRSPDGKMQPLKPGVLLLVKKVQCPIVPIGIAGAFDAFPRSKKFPTPAPIFLPPSKGCVGLSYGKPRDPATLAGLSREKILEVLAADIAAEVAVAEKIRRKPRFKNS